MKDFKLIKECSCIFNTDDYTSTIELLCPEISNVVQKFTLQMEANHFIVFKDIDHWDTFELFGGFVDANIVADGNNNYSCIIYSVDSEGTTDHSNFKKIPVFFK